jgi:hypothetical protein
VVQQITATHLASAICTSPQRLSAKLLCTAGIRYTLLPSATCTSPQRLSAKLLCSAGIRYTLTSATILSSVCVAGAGLRGGSCQKDADIGGDDLLHAFQGQVRRLLCLRLLCIAKLFMNMTSHYFICVNCSRTMGVRTGCIVSYDPDRVLVRLIVRR